ncbi:hypothetical protein [Reyranella sp.]|uniref:hypothetical protein n=1 Tax=Reyranella sp. TaxID=1929291 RepID=UPI0025E77F5D|nr:hypothetical protein [Reyranella sp.]
MTDYNPDPRLDPRSPRDRYADKYGLNERFDPSYEAVDGRSNYAFIALLAAVALVGGFLFFASPQPNDRQAETPPASMTTPAPAPAQTPAQAPGQDQAPTRLPAAPPEGPIQTPPDSVTPTNPQR